MFVLVFVVPSVDDVPACTPEGVQCASSTPEEVLLASANHTHDRNLQTTRMIVKAGFYAGSEVELI
jgi:hypothetical protein